VVVVYAIILHKFDQAWQLAPCGRMLFPGMARGTLRLGWIVGGMAALLLSSSLFCQQRAGADFDSVLRQAFELHQHARYSESLPLLRRAFRLQPNDYFVNLLLGIDLLRSGQASDAIPFLRTAARLRPKEEFPREYLGESHAHLGQFSEAVKAFLDATRLASGSEQAIIAFVDFSLERIRQISMELRATREGLAAEYRIEALAEPLINPSRARLLQQSAELDPAAPGIWSELALAHIILGQTTDAEQDLDNAHAANPNDLVALEAQAVQAAKNGAWQDAAGYLNRAAGHSPAIVKRAWQDWPRDLKPPAGTSITGRARLLFTCLNRGNNACELSGQGAVQPKSMIGVSGAGASASILFREQRWEQLTRLPQPSEQNREAWFFRGIALAETENCAAALPALERAREVKAHAVQALYSLSLCYAKATGNLASSFAGNQDDETVHTMRGDIFLRLRADSHAALAEYQLAMAKRPRDPAILERVAEAQLAAGQNDEAHKTAVAALSIDPQRVSAKRTLARLLMQERDYAAALPYLRDITSQDARDIASRIELGTASAQTGDYDEAVQNLAPLLEKGYPDQKGTLHYLLGTALRKLGRKQEAEAAFSAARQLSDQFQHGSIRDPK